MKLVASLFCVLSLASVTVAQTITVNPATSFQTIKGWEATAQVGVPDFTDWDDYKVSLMDQAAADGINRIRLEITIDSETTGGGTIVNDNGDPFVINAAGFNFTGGRSLGGSKIEMINMLRARLAAAGEPMPYIVLCYVDFEDGAGSFNHYDNPEEYAEIIQAAYLYLDANAGWVPDAIEIILEPDNGNNQPGWTATKIANNLLATQSRLAGLGWNPRFIVPSTVSCPAADTWYNNIKTAQPTTTQYIDELSYHRYVNCDATTLAQNKNAAAADGNYITMNELGAATYHTLHEDLKADATAWAQYALAYDNNDTGNHYYNVNHTTHVAVTSSRFKFIRQYFKWVRVGAIRKEATSNNGNIDAVAFLNTGGNYTVVVKALAAGNINVTGIPAGTYNITWTTAASYNQSETPQVIGSGGTVSTSIPAAGVLTVYADAPAQVTDHYASPSGTGSTCTSGSPCSLKTAFGATTPVGPGDTLYLRGGVYNAWGYKSRLLGAVGNLITVKSYPGEWAIIDPYRTATIVGAINSTQTNVTLSDATDLEVAQVLSAGAGQTREWMYVSARVGNDLTVIRGYGGTTATSHANGAEVAPKNHALELLNVGGYTTYRDFEVRNSDPTERARSVEFSPNPREDGIVVHAPNIKLINLVVHDAADGIGFWEDSTNSEIHGLIIYNNGWVMPDRGHGHGVYIQNSTGIKNIDNVVSVNNFATGMKAFGEGGFAVGVHFDEIIAANNSSPASYATSPWVDGGSAAGGIWAREQNLLVGTAVQPADNIEITNSAFYHIAQTQGGALQLGYLASGNGSIVVTDNYITGGASGMFMIDWATATVTGNTFYNTMTAPSVGFIGFAVEVGPTAPVGYTWNNNTWFDSKRLEVPTFEGFIINGARNNFTEWQAATGYDATSTYSATRPTGTTVFVRPNAYEVGRAHIAIYNWGLASTVSVDLSTTGLTNGQAFEIRNAFNFFGDRVLTGTYNSASPSVNVPMTGLSVATPIGHVFTPASIAPEFGAFVVLPTPNAMPFTSGTTPVKTKGRMGAKGKVKMQ